MDRPRSGDELSTHQRPPDMGSRQSLSRPCSVPQGCSADEVSPMTHHSSIRRGRRQGRQPAGTRRAELGRPQVGQTGCADEWADRRPAGRSLAERAATPAFPVVESPVGARKLDPRHFPSPRPVNPFRQGKDGRESSVIRWTGKAIAASFTPRAVLSARTSACAKQLLAAGAPDTAPEVRSSGASPGSCASIDGRRSRLPRGKSCISSPHRPRGAAPREGDPLGGMTRRWARPSGCGNGRSCTPDAARTHVERVSGDWAS